MLADKLRLLLIDGASYREAALALGKPLVAIARLVEKYDLPHREPNRLTSQQRAAVRRCIAEGMGGRRGGQAAKVGRETFWVYQQVARFRSLGKRANTPLPCKPWRCPKCGAKINTTICIKCGEHKPPGTSETRRKRS